MIMNWQHLLLVAVGTDPPQAICVSAKFALCEHAWHFLPNREYGMQRGRASISANVQADVTVLPRLDALPY